MENGLHYNNQSHKMAREKMQGHWHHGDRPFVFLANSKEKKPSQKFEKKQLVYDLNW